MMLFLGSGVSTASGLPRVLDLTDYVISEAKPLEVQRLLRLLRRMDTEYLQKSAPFKIGGKVGYTGQLFRAATTYEDLFYLARQIEINGEGLRADVTVGAFASLVTTRAREFLRGRTKAEREIDLHRLAVAAANQIETIVAEHLVPNQIVGLDLIESLATNEHTGGLDIVTLNHDTLVEQLLQRSGVDYSDGFGAPDGDVRWFEGDSPTRSVRLFKPHGSVSWWRTQRGPVAQPADVLRTDTGNWRDASGSSVLGPGRRPFFLTGLNKIYSYNQNIFADQMYSWLTLLQTERLIVMSGYGWADLPINFQLLNWFEKHPDNRLILLHREPEVLRDGALELRQVYSKYTSAGKLIPVTKWLSDVTLEELVGHM